MGIWVAISWPIRFSDILQFWLVYLAYFVPFFRRRPHTFGAFMALFPPFLEIMG